MIAALLMIGGIGLVGTVTATIASWIVQRVAQEDNEYQAATAAQIEALREEVRLQMEDLRDQIQQLKEVVTSQQHAPQNPPPRTSRRLGAIPVASPTPVDPVVYLTDYPNIKLIYIGSDLYNRPDYWGSMSPESVERMERLHAEAGLPIVRRKRILPHLQPDEADQLVRAEMQEIIKHRSNYPEIGLNLFPMIVGVNIAVKLDWNPNPDRQRDPVRDMDYCFTPWGGMYYKRQHAPDENGLYWLIYVDEEGVEHVEYCDTSAWEPYRVFRKHKKAMLKQHGLDGAA
jgi:hypothetical protein